MSDWISELGSRLVVGHKRDGRCVYSAQAKQELVIACRESGVSISKVARACGINANQLSAWIRRHERGSTKAVAPVPSAVQKTQPAFVSVAIEAAKQEAVVTLDLQARLPNGVIVDLRGCDMQQTQELIDALGRLRCSASTKG